MHCLNTLVCGAEAQASWSMLLRDALSTSLLQVTAYVHGAAELLGVQIDAAINRVDVLLLVSKSDVQLCWLICQPYSCLSFCQHPASGLLCRSGQAARALEQLYHPSCAFPWTMVEHAPRGHT